MGSDFDEAYLAYMQMTRQAIYEDNEPCVQAVINSAYWGARERIKKREEEGGNGKYIFLGIAIGIIFVTAFALFVWYYRKQANNQTSSLAPGVNASQADEKPTEHDKLSV